MEEAHEPNTTRDLPNRPLSTNLQQPATSEFIAHVETSTDLGVIEVRAETELRANVEAPANQAREGSLVARDEATDEGDDSDTKIYDVTIECSNLFQETGAAVQGSVGDRILIPVPQDDLGKATEGVNEHEPISVRDCVARLSGSFGHWSDYTGALALPQTSLDNRLQDHQEIKVMIIELLDMIARNLSHIVEDSDLTGPDEDKATAITRTLLAIEAALDRLHFLATAVRRASVQSNRYDLSGFRRDDDAYFELMAVLLVKRRFPHAKGTLHEQLGVSISVRRKRLIHGLRHADKLSFNREKVKSSRTQKHESTKSIIAGTQAEQKTHFAPRGMGLDTKASSATNYSRMNAGRAWDRIRRQPALSTISMGSSVEDVTIEHLYPEPPQFNPTDKSVPCPYCRKPLPALLLKGGSKSRYWRNHIDEDLEPYVCISEQCDKPLRFFRGQKAWASHMHGVHSPEWPCHVHKIKWYCDVDHPEPEEFGSRNQFEVHMRDKKIHENTPTDLQLAALSRRQQGPAPREQFACPFCECIPNSMKEVIQQSGQDDPDHVYTELSKHIGEHLKSLAFMSLPVLDAPTEVQNPQSKSDVDKLSFKRLRNRGSEPSLLSGWDDEIQSIDLGFHDPPIPDMQGQELDDPQYRLVLELGGDWLEWDIIPLLPHNPLEDSILKNWVNAGGGLRQNDIVIAVMGVTGVGKSTFISHFCPTAKIGNTLEDFTTTIEAHAAVIDGQPVFFLDTPGFDDGFDDTHRSERDILIELADWLNLSYQAEIKLAGILYLHRISDYRIRGEAMRNLRIFKKLCGEEALSCVVLATTMWDVVPIERAVLQEREFIESDALWGGMIKKGSKVFRQDDGVTSALNIIRYILSRHQATTLKIQEEMASGKSLDKTGAGLEIQEEMERMRAKHAQEMQELRDELRETQRQSDIRAQQEIAELRAALEKQ